MSFKIMQFGVTLFGRTALRETNCTLDLLRYVMRVISEKTLKVDQIERVLA